MNNSDAASVSLDPIQTPTPPPSSLSTMQPSTSNTNGYLQFHPPPMTRVIPIRDNEFRDILNTAFQVPSDHSMTRTSDAAGNVFFDAYYS